jgi:hypothetical protein
MGKPTSLKRDIKKLGAYMTGNQPSVENINDVNLFAISGF